MNDVLIVIFGIAFIFFMTSLGASLVYFFKNDISKKLNSAILGFASGVMIASSIWSLLLPSLDASSSWGSWSFVPAVIGFVVGGLFMVILDKVVPQLHFIHTGAKVENQNNSGFYKTAKMVLAVTIHNIPEGLAVGFAFGAAFAGKSDMALISALGLAIGIGVQNFPEGTAVALPVREITGSRNKGFLCGVMSGAVEPIFAIVGFFLASALTVVQPWLLAFAAGSMMFVVVEDLIPDSKFDDASHIGTWGFIVGFVIMMILDVALG